MPVLEFIYMLNIELNQFLNYHNIIIYIITKASKEITIKWVRLGCRSAFKHTRANHIFEQQWFWSKHSLSSLWNNFQNQLSAVSLSQVDYSFATYCLLFYVCKYFSTGIKDFSHGERLTILKKKNFRKPIKNTCWNPFREREKVKSPLAKSFKVQWQKHKT